MSMMASQVTMPTSTRPKRAWENEMPSVIESIKGIKAAVFMVARAPNPIG